MENGTGFFSRHKLVFIGLAGVILGVILNSMVRNYENQKFLSMLREELKGLEYKSQNGELTADQKNILDKLKTEIYIMKFRCEA